MKLIIDISEELYAKVPYLINKGNVLIRDILDAVEKGTPLEAQPTNSVGMDKTKLDIIEQYLIDNVFENPNVMFSDECRGEEVDLVSIIAGMFEYLHIMVKGEPYEYMFHWANKIGADVEEKRFDEMICRIMKEEQDE